MTSLHIAQIGDLFQSPERFLFVSKQNLLEYDFIVIHVEHLYDMINRQQSDYVHNRFSEFIDFTKKKDIPIVFFCTYSGAYVSSSGEELDIYSSLAIDVEEIHTGGRKIDITPNTLFTNLIHNFAHEFRYSLGFAKHPGISIGNVKSKNVSVGFYTKDIVFLPDLSNELGLNNEEDFLKELYQVCRSIRKGDEVTIVPDWTNEYFLPSEKDERDKLNKIESDIKHLLKEKATSETTLASFLPLKQLWSATGAILELSAKQLFEELGFTILPTEPNRDDIIMSWNDQIIIVEVKGLTKSAGEKNAAQLEKWLSEYLSEKDIVAKGILLVNAYRELPIDERTQAAFPAQMVPYATRRDQCLLTTIQLCSILLHCRENNNERENIIQELINTVGMYDKFNNWEQYIDYSKKFKAPKKNKPQNGGNTVEIHVDFNPTKKNNFH